MNVLLTESSGYKAVCIAAFLKKSYPAIRVVTCDRSPLTRWIRTKYSDAHHLVPDPSRDSLRYVVEIERVCRSESIDLIIPTNSVEMPFLLAERARFDRALDYWGSTDSFNTLNNKESLHILAREVGLRVPRTHKSIQGAAIPFVVKPRVSSGSKGVLYAFSEADRRRILEQSLDEDALVIQEYVPGRGAGFSAFCVSGAVVVGYSHVRLAEFPASGGSSVYRQTFNDEVIRSAAARLIAETRWSGFCMIEFKVSDGGESCLIEANPRIWGSINQGLVNGVNYFEPLLGPRKFASVQSGDIRTYHSPLLYFSFLQYLWRFELAPIVRFFRNLGSNRSDISWCRDPLGWLGFLTRV